MEQLFAVRVLVHYYDKPKVDHAAVRRLLCSAGVEAVRLLANDGSTLKISDHIETASNSRKNIVEVLGSCGTSLVQIGSVFMLAEARAASDSLCTSPGELEVACSALERLLGFLHTASTHLPTTDIRRSARLKIGPTWHRRALHRISRSTLSDASQVSTLRAVNAILRLCDVATHCLAVVCRQSLLSKATCETAVSLSTRLLTLACSLHEVRATDSKPSLSFFSSNSLRTALVAGAMHLGTIIVEYASIDAMGWVHVANRILFNNRRVAISPRVSILSALFGGMISSAKLYEESERDMRRAEGAVSLLSTLHLILEIDMARGSAYQHGASEHTSEHLSDADIPSGQGRSSETFGNIGSLSQAARSFLGERVVAAEEDGDEGRIATGTVYHACEEYAERTGEQEGIIGLLVRLFEAAGRHFSQESVDESVVSISEGTLPCPPDESDDCSDAPPLRQESAHFVTDISDSKFRDLYGPGTVAGSTSEVGTEQTERIELHKEIGALALDTLGKWLEMAKSLKRYHDLDVFEVSRRVCTSSSLFVLNNSSTSYDLRAAMVDFGSFIGPELQSNIKRHLANYSRKIAESLITSLIESCPRASPVLSSIIRAFQEQSIVSLWKVFLLRERKADIKSDRHEETASLPTPSLLTMIMTVTSDKNAIVLLGFIMDFLTKLIQSERALELSISHTAACLILLSYSASVFLGVTDCLDFHRIAIAALYHRDADLSNGPSAVAPENAKICVLNLASNLDTAKASSVRSQLENALQVTETICARLGPRLARNMQTISNNSVTATGTEVVQEASAVIEVKQFYHLYWSLMMVQRILSLLEDIGGTGRKFAELHFESSSEFEFFSPFMAEKASRHSVAIGSLKEALSNMKGPTIASLYAAECAALYFCFRPNPETLENKSWILGSIIQSSLHFIVDSIYEELPNNYNRLRDAFRSFPLLELRASMSEVSTRTALFKENVNEMPVAAAFQLAMSYMRVVGSGRLADVLANSFISASLLLNHLPPEHLKTMRSLIVQVISHLIFVPRLGRELSGAMLLFVDTFLSKSFDKGSSERWSIDGTVTFMARACGFAQLTGRSTSSPRVIRSLCMFARDTAVHEPSEEVIKLISFQSPIPEEVAGDNEFREWLTEAVPRISLAKFLPSLLIPKEESAVAISIHGESFNFLTEASQNSEFWRNTFLSALGTVHEADESFTRRMVIRSVVESATLNDGILSVIEKIVSVDDSELAIRFLQESFRATCHVFEKEPSAGLEGKCRLLNFAVRVTLCYGRVSARCEKDVSPALLEPALFDFLLNALQQTSSNLKLAPKDVASKRLVLLLGKLLDCIENGLHFHSGGDANTSAVVQNQPECEIEAEVPNAYTEALRPELETDVSEVKCEEADAKPKQLCTYTSTGDQYAEQHWYFCYSCGLSESEGVCSVCARECHKGCELAYSKFSRFFCDCGAGSEARQESASQGPASSEDGEGSNVNSQDQASSGLPTPSTRMRRRRGCLCLKPSDSPDKPLKSTDPVISAKQDSTAQKERESTLESALQGALTTELRLLYREKNSLRWQHGEAIKKVFRTTLKGAVDTLTNTALYLTREVDNSHVQRKRNGKWRPLTEIRDAIEHLSGRDDFIGNVNHGKPALCTKLLRPGSYDVSQNLDSSSKDLDVQGSLIDYSCHEGILAVVEKSNSIEFVDACEDLFSERGLCEKFTSRSFRRISIQFDIKKIAFHPSNSNLLVVVGTKKVSVFMKPFVNGSGDGNWSQIEVEIGLSEYAGYDGENNLIDVSWIDEDATLLLVVTSDFVKIFDVAIDTFCPCFFARTPISDTPVPPNAANDTKDESKVKPLKSKIVAAAFARNHELLSADGFLLFLLTSESDIFVTSSRRNQTTSPVFHYCCNALLGTFEGVDPHAVESMIFLADESLFMISFANGALLCLSFSVKSEEDQLYGIVHAAHIFKDVFEPGCAIEFKEISGLDRTFLFCEKHQKLGGGGLLIVGDQELAIHAFSTVPSTTVLGCSSFSASPFVGEPSSPGGMFLLDDGSLQRLDICEGKERIQLLPQEIVSAIIERQQNRTRSIVHSNRDNGFRGSFVPNSVGFFEKCRPVSDAITIERLDSDLKSMVEYDRMGVILGDGGPDCVVSPIENQPFRFTAILENRSLVIVGARMRFGGTERSKRRVPAEVRVFSRTVPWNSRNGMKRWLDVPFSVPESTSSPHKVTIELFPRRISREGRLDVDGLCAIDALELHTVSNIEFTERKLLHEKENSGNPGESKEKDETIYEYLRETISNTRSSENNFRLPSEKLPEDQMALLTILNSIHRGQFLSSSLAGELLCELNSLWSSELMGPKAIDALFLQKLVHPSITLCLPELMNPSKKSDDSRNTVIMNVFSSGTRDIVFNYVVSYCNKGIVPHFIGVEKCLFMVATICRSLFATGLVLPSIPLEQWASYYDRLLPTEDHMLILLRANLAVGRRGRLLYKSLDGVAINVADLFMALCIRKSIAGKDLNEFVALDMIVDMLCSLDQRLRLCISQRLIELFDSLGGGTGRSDNPFQSVLSHTLLSSLKAHHKEVELSQSPTKPQENESTGSDETPRWAYRCDGCTEVCDQEWWHCADCDDFDLCTKCLRSPPPCLTESHKANHVLLRGTSEDDTDAHVIPDEHPAAESLLVQSGQGIISAIVTKVMERVMAEESSCSHWRYLDAAEAISQLLGSSIPLPLKYPRLQALFDSSFPSLFRQLSDVIRNEYKNATVASDGMLTVTPRCADVFILMLGILLCASGSNMAAFIHKHDMPATLFTLLESLHPRLQDLGFHVNTSDRISTRNARKVDLLSRTAWNKMHPDLTYQILSRRQFSKEAEISSDMCLPSENAGSSNNVFINIILEAVHVLEFSFGAASNTLIVEQMKQFPRKILCDIINFCDSSQQKYNPTLLRNLADSSEKLLCVLSMDNPDELNDVLDRYLYDNQNSRLKALVSKQSRKGGILVYDSALEVASILGVIRKASKRHPDTWRKYAVTSDETLSSVFEVAKLTSGDLQGVALQLLAAGFSLSDDHAIRVMNSKPIFTFESMPGAQSDQDFKSTTSRHRPEDEIDAKKVQNLLDDIVDASQSNLQASLHLFTTNNFELIQFLLFEILLKSHNKQSRQAAADILTCTMARAASNAKDHFKLIDFLNTSLKRTLALMPYAGSLSDGLMTCLRLFILFCQGKNFGPLSESFLSVLASDVSDLLVQRCNLLISHPNARLYGKLSSILDIQGYYLEAYPCLTCSATTWESSESHESRLDTIKAETKYTDCSMMHRLLSPHEINSVSVKIIDPRRTRRVKKIDISYSSRTVSDAAELKGQTHPWKRLKCIDFTSTSTESSVDLIVPIQAANVKFEFSEFYETQDVQNSGGISDQDRNRIGSSPGVSESYRNSRTGESLQCPRCSRTVTDRHGICRNCHENAYQCRQCRNINYENLDGFLCNECGYCKHGRFEFSVTGRTAYITDPVCNESDRKRSSDIIEKETLNVHRCMEQLARIRSTIIRSLATGSPADQSHEKNRIPASSRLSLGDFVPPRTELAMLEALLEGQVSNDVEEATNSTQGGVNITEDAIGEGNGSVDVHDREQSHQTVSNSASPLNRHGRVDNHQASSIPETNVISRTTSALASIYAKECRALYTEMSRGVRVLTMTRAELVHYANSIDKNRLDHAKELFLSNRDHQSNQMKANVEDIGTNWHNQPCCYGCTQSFVANGVKLVQTIMRSKESASGALCSPELVKYVLRVCSQCEKDEVRNDIHELITSLVRDNPAATKLVCEELESKISFCIDSWETVDSNTVARFDIGVLDSISRLDDACWEERLRLVMTILFKASSRALTCSSVAESIILPCLQATLRILREDAGLSCPTDEESSDAMGMDVVVPSIGPTTTLGFDVRNAGDDSRDEDLSNVSERQDLESRSHLPFPNSIAEPSAEVVALDLDSEGMRTTMENGPDDLISRVVTEDERVSVDNESLRLRSNSENNKSDISKRYTQSSLRSTTSDNASGSAIIFAEDQTSGATIPLSEARAVLESLHDRKIVSADISQWLDRKSSQSMWAAHLMRERNCIETQRFKVIPTRPDEKFVLAIYLRAWKGMISKTKDANPSQFNILRFEENNWIIRLMLFTPCTAVRKECCALLEFLCENEQTLQLQLLDLLTGHALSLSAVVEDMSLEFFDLLETVLAPISHRLYLISKGFLPRLTKLIQSIAEALVMSEAESHSSMRLVSFMEGFSLKRLIIVLRQCIEAITPQQTASRRKLFGGINNGIVTSLQRAYLCLRKLISMRTTLTDECAARLCEILLSKKFLFFGPSVSSVVSACVTELKSAKNRNDAQAIAILLSELCLMLCPERKEPTCHLSLNKAPSQEEFIRGNMTRNPYISSSFDGPLMRDVKNKICRDLDLPGLLEDDFAMELLVAGNLIKLDLPIMGVYEHVWCGSAAAAMSSSIQPGHLPRVMGLRRSAHVNPSRGGIGPPRNGSGRSGTLSFRRAIQERNAADVAGRPQEIAEPPMVIIYRLSGLDGEATEPIVDSLRTDSKHDQDGEDQFRDTIILGQFGGLDLLFELLSVVESWGDDAETAVRAPALRLLRASCEVAQNRAALAKSPNAVSTLLDCAASAFEHAQGSPAAVKSAESLLIAAEQILAQQRHDLESHTDTGSSTDSMHISVHKPKEVISRVRVFLGRLSLATSPTAENSILHLLPFLVQGNPDAIDMVLQHMQFGWDGIDAGESDQKKARQLGTVLLATPRDFRGNEFIAQAVRSGIVDKALTQIIRKFPIPRRERRSEWQQSLESRGPPLILRLLTGMSLFLGSKEEKLKASETLRSSFQNHSDIIPVLCQVEMAVSGNSVGSSAEELLEALSRDVPLQVEIEKERESIKSARREAARLSRMAILKEAGLSSATSQHSHTPKSIEDAKDPSAAAEKSVLTLMEELPDEKGPSCVVCGDGFQCTPEEALALYVHCRKVSLDLSPASGDNSQTRIGHVGASRNNQTESRLDWEVWTNGNSRNGASSSSKAGVTSCFTTVTHLNAIHLTCHKEAVRMDRGSRRDEWDGASLRNSQTRCNNMFPVRPPATLKIEKEGEAESTIKAAKLSYTTAVEGYFKRLASLGRVSVPQSKAALYDIGRSLLRFADGGSIVFSEHSRGGGAHSNASFIPHLVQLAIHMIEISSSIRDSDPFVGNSTLQMMREALSKYIGEGENGDLTYYMALSLVLYDIEQWNEAECDFFRRCVQESSLPRPILYRLFVFTDLVNRVLKNGAMLAKDQTWLDCLRKHIGLDESFPQSFGDVVNERWEGYIRSIGDKDELLEGLRKNLTYGRERDVNECERKMIEEIATYISSL